MPRYHYKVGETGKTGEQAEVSMKMPCTKAGEQAEVSLKMPRTADAAARTEPNDSIFLRDSRNVQSRSVKGDVGWILQWSQRACIVWDFFEKGGILAAKRHAAEMWGVCRKKLSEREQGTVYEREARHTKAWYTQSL